MKTYYRENEYNACIKTIIRFFFQNLFTKSIYKMIYKNNFYSRRLYFLYINAIFLMVIKGHDHSNSLVLLKNIHEFFFKIR